MRCGSSACAYTYNANGRVTSVDNLGTPNIPRVVLTSTYDNLSRRTQLAASVASTADFRTNYKYDSLSRITQITQQGQAGGNTVATKRIDFAYNAVGQYTTVTRYATLATNKLVATSTNNRLTSDGTYNDQYDGEGNRTRRTEIATGKYDVLECAGFIPAFGSGADRLAVSTIDIRRCRFTLCGNWLASRRSSTAWLAEAV